MFQNVLSDINAALSFVYNSVIASPTDAPKTKLLLLEGLQKDLLYYASKYHSNKPNPSNLILRSCDIRIDQITHLLQDHQSLISSTTEKNNINLDLNAEDQPVAPKPHRFY